MNNTFSTVFFSLPGRYANALLKSDEQSFSKDFKTVLDALNEDPISERLLDSIHLDKKHLLPFMETLGEILNLKRPFINFLKVLVASSRLNLLKDIYRCYTTLWNKKNNERYVDVFSAAKLSLDDRANINNKLCDFFTEKLHFNYVINPDLLGGFLIESAGIRIDASVFYQIQRIKEDFGIDKYA